MPVGPTGLAEPPSGTAVQRAAQVMTTLVRVSAERIFANQSPLSQGAMAPQRILENNCQLFFRAVGEELARQGLPAWNSEFPLTKLGELTADKTAEWVAKNTSGAWLRIGSWSEAQQAANDGAVVIGALRADASERRVYGHLVVVVPMKRSINPSEADGPYVLDGNERLLGTTPDDPHRVSRVGADLDAWQWFMRLR